MHPPLTKQNQFGRYALETEGRLIIARFSGAISENLARGYHQGLLSLAKEINGPWGYIADCSDNYQASTPQAMAILEQVYRDSLACGCVGDAYCIKSAMGVAQLEQIRAKVITTSSIYERIYVDLDSAKHALSQQIEDITL
ncbi:hypothetical protein HMF8227_02534 [Saliniradius amylolyticus]|uniref:Uncharacterized protein n=1 Tax=Saliniradius amylolyticus TaxID=2183582 RepID=A0A2S2E5Q5_9ALTE|nr:hypothetical protein [Saliniradius amylolyticus]AWL12986.1 hypothetical protein HMF8227_02534 [Saliniradius amylolyticus]